MPQGDGEKFFRTRDIVARSTIALFVAALCERRIIFLSEISSDGHRPPLQKNAKNYLPIFACSLACDLDCARRLVDRSAAPRKTLSRILLGRNRRRHTRSDRA